LFSGLKDAWSRMPSHARWMRDVLIVHAGLALVRKQALPVGDFQKPARPAMGDEDERLGSNPVLVRLRLDDGSLVAVTATKETKGLLAGPFVVTMPRLSEAPAV
jgi:hypothetical protein